MNSRFSKSALALVLASSLIFTACGKKADPSEYSSANGFVPEAFMPGNAAFVLSFSLKDAAQREAVNSLEERIGDQGRLEETLVEAWELQAGESAVDYQMLLDSLGEEYRMVFSAGLPEESGAEQLATFAAVTLTDVKAMEDSMAAFVEDGEFEEKKLSKSTAWVNEESQLYMAIHEDMLLMSNTPERLTGMMDQKESESLWSEDRYQDALAEVGTDHLAYAVIYPQEVADEVQAFADVGSLAQAMERQLLVVRAEEDGLGFSYGMRADKTKIDELELAFDRVPHEPPYLFEEIPAEGLMAYVESFGLSQTLERAGEVSGEGVDFEQINTMTRSYLGVDFEDEILPFLDKGYAMALHKNGEGIFPGITLMADVSSDVEGAEDFADSLDTQVSSLLLILQSALPDSDAVTKGVKELNGVELNELAVDLSVLGQFGASPLPGAITQSEIQLVYGVADERFILSTASALYEEGDSLSESELYTELSEKLESADEGLILVDAAGVAEFVGSLRALREQLDLGVDELQVQVEEILEGFVGVIAASETQAYETRFEGFLMVE